ncbi:2-amino-4-hydroxy-6-hydroxymethyldihydropteridine diphosphokinase [Emcibacter nanhaiensis]|uniref:2-amino-4-hydroxy-6-hydroxymethyldihydropteridine pyrophosphokinase n=1 Tax=Emcibacter nanhaiensis TaxID=1505037 RepID=A0A501PS55_9PROT|nr:2-amino-4-hydroxy-6-hydroxymethyldihydropteridine diphosphokinase [Emcibacter nanhaiensis]TPD62616.1 2-amino-4-hydroxy-6-hydroxymethyldihydropteridine diphosphokinase [Emcibacter nanhaiensis]
MILIGFGGNLPSPEHGAPENNIRAAIEILEAHGVELDRLSAFYETEPVPVSDQPWYVNAVASVTTALGAGELLELLHTIEQDLGRVRNRRWEARLIDLDLLAYDDLVLPSPESWAEAGKMDPPTEPVVPHPRMHLRAFVLDPLMDIAPDWRHPVFGRTARELRSELEDPGRIRKLVR